MSEAREAYGWLFLDAASTALLLSGLGATFVGLMMGDAGLGVLFWGTVVLVAGAVVAVFRGLLGIIFWRRPW